MQRLPGPTEKVPGALLLEFRRDPLVTLMRISGQCGGMARFRLGFQRVYLLSKPEYIADALVRHNNDMVKSRGLRMAKNVLGEGLLTSEGDLHDRQRRLVQPAFRHERIASYAAMMPGRARSMTERWRDGEVVDIHKEMMGLTMGIVAKALFGAEVESKAEEVAESLEAFLKNFNRVTNPLAPLLERLPLPSNRRFRRGKERLDALIYRVIREGEGKPEGSLLSALVAARGDGTTDLQIRDEMVTLFLAGHETTANALTWGWYLLSQNPRAEARLHEELDSVLDGRLPEPDDVPRLGYTAKVLTESMRLYPPAWVVGRQTLRETEIGGHRIPAKSLLLMSQYVMHHDPKHFPDPERFDPDRWTPEMKASLPRFAYFPFGGGPRACIGEPFAWSEGILLMATIARDWRMSLLPGHRVALLPRLTLRPRYGMKMVLGRRPPGPQS